MSKWSDAWRWASLQRNFFGCNFNSRQFFIKYFHQKIGTKMYVLLYSWRIDFRKRNQQQQHSMYVCIFKVHVFVYIFIHSIFKVWITRSAFNTNKLKFLVSVRYGKFYCTIINLEINKYMHFTLMVFTTYWNVSTYLGVNLFK